MSVPDDEQFKSYLKGFRPVAPGSLLTKSHSVATRRKFVLAAGAAACLVVLVLAFFSFPQRQRQTKPAAIGGSLAATPQSSQQLLTIGRANALLAHAPSFKAAVEQVSSQPRAVQLSEGKQSALSVLGKESIKL